MSTSLFRQIHHGTGGVTTERLEKERAWCRAHPLTETGVEASRDPDEDGIGPIRRSWRRLVQALTGT